MRSRYRNRGPYVPSGLKRTAALAIVALMAGAATAAQESDPGPIVTDRPDVTESSAVVPRGFVLIEAGYTFASLELDGSTVEVSSIPATLVRVGLDRTVELRFEWLGYVSTLREVNGVDTDDSGSGNTALGVKIKLREERGAAPQLALLVDAALPTGKQSLRAERIDPAVRVLGSHTLSERVALAWNLGVAALTLEDDGGEVDTHALGRYSVAAAFAITERWGAFAELFGFIPLNGPDSPANLFDGGFTYLVRDSVQLDVSAGVGLNDHADDWFFGAGISFRLPH